MYSNSNINNFYSDYNKYHLSCNRMLQLWYQGVKECLRRGIWDKVQPGQIPKEPSHRKGHGDAEMHV